MKITAKISEQASTAEDCNACPGRLFLLLHQAIKKSEEAHCFLFNRPDNPDLMEIDKESQEISRKALEEVDILFAEMYFGLTGKKLGDLNGPS